MLERESILPLTLGLVVVLVLHAAFLPSVTLWALHGYDDHGRNLVLPAMDPPIAPPPPPLVRFGQATPSAATVAWIAYEDFQKMIAPQGQTEQPAMQKDVDPIPGAPMPDLPTPPAPHVPLTMMTPLTPPPAPPSLQLPALAEPVPAVIRAEIRPPASQRKPQPAPPASPQPPTPTKSNPTSAPRSDAESPPVQLTDEPLPVRPGEVIAIEGLTIITVKPKFSLSTVLTSLPVNPEAIITFAADGTVTDVKLTKRSGYQDVDDPVEAALYRWRLTGDKLKEWNRPIVGEWRILLRREK
jgi:hypothetical protein